MYMEEQYKQIRGNFIEEMTKYIKRYKVLKEECRQQCIIDCDINIKLDENEKPSIFTRDRKTKKQDIKRNKCSELFAKSNIVNQCSKADTSTTNTKLTCDKVVALYKKIESLFAMYEKEQNDVYREKLNLQKGMIDIKFIQEDSDSKEDSNMFIQPVLRSDYVIDVKNKIFAGDGKKYDFTYKNMRLDDDMRLEDYSIMSGDTILITLKPTGGSQKRRTMRKRRV